MVTEGITIVEQAQILIRIPTLIHTVQIPIIIPTLIIIPTGILITLIGIVIIPILQASVTDPMVEVVTVEAVHPEVAEHVEGIDKI